MVNKDRWAYQAVKVTKVCQDLVGNLVSMGSRALKDPKVLKVNQAHLDQGPKDFLVERGLQDVLDHQVQRGIQDILETLGLQEPSVPAAPKDILEPQDAEVHLVLLVKRAVMALQGTMALQVPPASRVTKGLLEILVQLVQEETRDRTVYQDLLERKEPWELLELAPVVQKGRKEHLGVLGRRVLLVPVVPLVPVVLKDTQDVLVLLDLLVPLVFLV